MFGFIVGFIPSYQFVCMNKEEECVKIRKIYDIYDLGKENNKLDFWSIYKIIKSGKSDYEDFVYFIYNNIIKNHHIFQKQQEIINYVCGQFKMLLGKKYKYIREIKNTYNAYKREEEIIDSRNVFLGYIGLLKQIIQKINWLNGNPNSVICEYVGDELDLYLIIDGNIYKDHLPLFLLEPNISIDNWDRVKRTCNNKLETKYVLNLLTETLQILKKALTELIKTEIKPIATYTKKPMSWDVFRKE